VKGVRITSWGERLRHRNFFFLLQDYYTDIYTKYNIINMLGGLLAKEKEKRKKKKCLRGPPL
jgi:hypothetical protein